MLFRAKVPSCAQKMLRRRRNDVSQRSSFFTQAAQPESEKASKKAKLFMLFRAKVFSCALKMLTRRVHKDVRSYHIVSLVETFCFSGETFCFHCRNKMFPLFMLMRNKLEQTESQSISCIIYRTKSRKKHKGCIGDDFGVCSIHPLINCDTGVCKQNVGMYRQIENFL